MYRPTLSINLLIINSRSVLKVTDRDHLNAYLPAFMVGALRACAINLGNIQDPNEVPQVPVKSEKTGFTRNFLKNLWI